MPALTRGGMVAAAGKGRSLAAVAVITCALVGGCGGGRRHVATPTSRAGLPAGFLGMVSNDAFAANAIQRAQILAAERRTGVQLLRQTFDWSQIEPRRGAYDFSAYDSYVSAAARAGLQVLPVVFGRPAFEPGVHAAGAPLTATTTLPPGRLSDFAAFASALARRYGPDGMFWRAHPGVPAHPVTAWQVWNEPNLPVYWGGRPDAAGYVAMLSSVGHAIKSVDPAAEIVTAGIPDSRLGVPLGRYVLEMIAAGARGTFDTLAINPYATSDLGVLAAARQVRQLLDASGLSQTSIWFTELGWASGGPASSFTVGPALQARYVLGAITSLARVAGALHIRGVVYYDWRDAPPYAGGQDFWGLHTGLLTLAGAAKPALSAYYQAAGVLGALPSKHG